MLKDEMSKIIELRKIQLNEDPLAPKLSDYKDIINILSADYNETISFLRNATYEEIGCASWVLEELIDIFPTQELFDCFKIRVDEFSENDAKENCDKPSIIYNSFKEEVDYAEKYLQGYLKTNSYPKF